MQPHVKTNLRLPKYPWPDILNQLTAIRSKHLVWARHKRISRFKPIIWRKKTVFYFGKNLAERDFSRDRLYIGWIVKYRRFLHLHTRIDDSNVLDNFSRPLQVHRYRNTSWNNEIWILNVNIRPADVFWGLWWTSTSTPNIW